MADIKIAVEEGAVDAVSDLTAVAEPVSIPLTEESALVTVLPEVKEETTALAGNATKRIFPISYRKILRTQKTLRL